ncbi:glycosyltransferase [Chitinilyticum litopenaei]|uniref:glycosyltransferase n=1 Tax=Chitinilyticum litopenaei TaxID=1121276 RepID=UPI000417205A|nr:glycosyltransferase [Chitinilyticum litopenaei]
MRNIVMIAQPIQHIPPKKGAAVEWWMWQVCRQLAASGQYMPHIICTGENDSAPEHEIRDGVHFYRITLSPVYKRIFQKWTRLDPCGYAVRAARYCRRIGAHIVHTHNSPKLHSELARHLPGFTLLLHMHNEMETAPDLRACCLVTVSQYLAGWYRQKLPEMPIRVLTNGIDRQAFLTKQPQPEWRTQLPANSRILLFAGRISPEKGLLLLAQAFTLLSATLPELHLVIIGERVTGNNTRAQYAHRVSELLAPLANRVHWIGVVQPEDMSHHYPAADLLVVPSEFEEPFGMVCLEGMAAGVPVLAARKGGLPEFVRHGETGFLMEEPRSPAILAAQIRELLSAPDELACVANQAADYARNHHDWPLVAQHLAHIYESCN